MCPKVEGAPQNSCHQYLCPQVEFQSPPASLGGSPVHQVDLTQAPFKPLLLHLILACVRLCVHLLRVE